MPHDHALHACPDFLVDFTDFVDGSLPAGRRGELQAHLDCCEGCLGHLSAYRRGIAAYQGLPVLEVDGEEFWLGMRIRLATEDAVEERRPPVAWRAPAMAGAAVALVALATVWLGIRIDAGFERVARDPVVAAAPASVGEVAENLPAQPASTAPVQLASAAPVRPASSSRAAARNATTAPDPVIEREFEALREEIEIAAWLGDPYLEASDRAFEPAAGQVRIQTASWSY